MHDVALENLSGWILPDGSWRPVEEWWHVSALYDYISEGLLFARTEEYKNTLNNGDETKIRHFAATIGLVKIGKNIIDAYNINSAQLKTIQELYNLCKPETELEWLQENGKRTFITVEKIMKCKKIPNSFV
jgi:hypothetical protein